MSKCIPLQDGDVLLSPARKLCLNIQH